MLFEIFVTVPSLVMAEIAWLVRFALAVSCLLVLFAVAIGAVGLRWRREPAQGRSYGSVTVKVAGPQFTEDVENQIKEMGLLVLSSDFSVS